jgi:PAS domain S-box-containing protein
MPNNTNPTAPDEALRRQNEELRFRLAEAEETLRAIREGEVDAVIVSGSKGEQVFSLVGTDSIYRLIVETMKEAAFTITFDGKILFCNVQFGELVKRSMESVVGHPFHEFVAETDRASAAALLVAVQQKPVKRRLVFQDVNRTDVPAYVSANVLNLPDGLSICVVANDLTELENSTDLIQQLRRQQEALRQKSEELQSSNKQLAYFNSLMVNREVRMVELKREIDRLCHQFGQPSRYGYDVADPAASGT